ncbi:MAG: biotin--[acetyl-CoA-carboxylase] ligase, partial [Pseudomonadota bacterium]
MSEYDDRMTDLSSGVIESEATSRFTGDVSVRVLERVGSTNTWVKDFIAGTSLAPGETLVCAAEHQTAGRGRRGRVWHSPWRGVTFTTAFGVSQPAHQLSGLSLLCGVAVCTVLRESGINGAAVKWPNDILIEQAKLAGILIEVIGVRANSAVIVAGIGVNYRRGHEAALIDQSSTDLYQLLGDSLPDRSVLIGAMVGELRRCCAGNIAESVAGLAPRWHDYDALRGKQVECTGDGAEPLTGTAVGIDQLGRLLIQTDSGNAA